MKNKIIFALWITLNFPLSFAYASDLSDGIKGLKLGMSKADSLAILKNYEESAGGLFAYFCKPQGNGEQCSIFTSSMTYGKIPLLKWQINFKTPGKNLNNIHFLLSKQGCARNSSELPPSGQFEKLSTTLVDHYGIPDLISTESTGHAKVWVDERINAGLVLSLISHPIPGIGYENCPIVTISLSTEEYSKSSGKKDQKSKTKDGKYI